MVRVRANLLFLSPILRRRVCVASACSRWTGWGTVSGWSTRKLLTAWLPLSTHYVWRPLQLPRPMSMSSHGRRPRFLLWELTHKTKSKNNGINGMSDEPVHLQDIAHQRCTVHVVSKLFSIQHSLQYTKKLCGMCKRLVCTYIILYSVAGPIRGCDFNKSLVYW